MSYSYFKFETINFKYNKTVLMFLIELSKFNFSIVKPHTYYIIAHNVGSCSIYHIIRLENMDSHNHDKIYYKI